MLVAINSELACYQARQCCTTRGQFVRQLCVRPSEGPILTGPTALSARTTSDARHHSPSLLQANRVCLRGVAYQPEHLRLTTSERALVQSCPFR